MKKARFLQLEFKTGHWYILQDRRGYQREKVTDQDASRVLTCIRHWKQAADLERLIGRILNKQE